MSIAHRARRGLAAVAAVGVAAPALALVATAVPAHASSTITNAQFRWGFNNESNNAGFAPGTFNLFSAGIIGNPEEGGQTLSNADSGATWANGKTAGWKAVDGNVVIEKKQSDGTYATTTWAGTKTAADGSTVTVNGGKFSDHQVVINKGTGTLDAAADDADITWDGDFTALYYSGMTYFTVADPHLVVDDGTGTLTATVGGCAADMDDSTTWNALPSQTVTLATLSNVDVTTSGIDATPDYVDVAYDAGSYTPQTAKTSANAAFWGSFPQSFVDFQQLTGSSSYWYSSGGSADPRKVALPLQVVVTPPSTPTVTVDKTTVSADASTVVTVTGTGFDPAAATATRPPLSGKPAGVYVAFGKYAANWRPSAGAASTARKNATGGGLKWAVPADSMATIGGAAAGAIELSADGSFTADITVDKAALDATATDASLVNYGIYTYAGGGATQAAYETYTPLTFQARVTPTVVISAPGSTYGASAIVKATIEGATGDLTLTGAGAPITESLVDGVATFVLPADLAVGSHDLTLAYGGDENHHEVKKTATLVVAKVAGQVSVTGAASKTYGAASSLVVRTPGTGTVRVTGLGIATTLNVVDRAATFAIPADLPVGVWHGTVTYSGDVTHLGSSTTVAITVTKAAAAVSPTAATKLKVAKKAVIVLKVAGPAGTAPTGKVKAVLKHGKKKVKLKAATVKNGEVRLKITKKQAKKLSKGTWKLSASYAGDGSFKPWSQTLKVTVTK